MHHNQLWYGVISFNIYTIPNVNKNIHIETLETKTYQIIIKKMYAQNNDLLFALNSRS